MRCAHNEGMKIFLPYSLLPIFKLVRANFWLKVDLAGDSTQTLNSLSAFRNKKVIPWNCVAF
jgi:hypothetical protein